VIYVCVPTRNDARTLGPLLWRLRTVLAQYPRDYCVLVHDDASDDATPEVLQQYARVMPLESWRSDTPIGSAAALDRLLRAAVAASEYPRRDGAVVLQGDFQDAPEDLPELLRRFESGADVVVGVPPSDGSPAAVRWLRRYGLPWAVRWRTRRRLRDPVAGFRLFRLQVLRRALQARGAEPLLRRPGWAGQLELLLATLPYARRSADVLLPARPPRRVRPAEPVAFWPTAQELWAVLTGSTRRTSPRALASDPKPAP